jgi:hypothetical protein
MARRMVAYFVFTASLLATSFLQWETSTSAAEKVTKASTPEYWLGIICHPVKKLEKASSNLKVGLVVDEVVPESPAVKAGIIKGDILIKVADQDLRKVDELVALIATCHDKKITLQIVRDGREQSMRVTLAPRPAVIDFSNTKIPLKPALGNDDGAKRKQLMEAAKLAMARLESTKAKEDAAKPENAPTAEKPHGTKAVENPSLAVGKLSDGPAVGSVSHAGKTWRVTPKSADALPEGGREHVQMSFLRLEPEANEPKPLAAVEPAKLSAAEIQLLEKRVDEIDRKLDEVLQLLKTEPARSAKKKK